jgi:membrane protein implicated in regulation of membrane protease activity
VGAIIGTVLAFMLFDWALIILSSVAGALLIIEGLQLAGPIAWLVAVVLFIVGVVVQSRLERPPRPQRRRAAAPNVQ